MVKRFILSILFLVISLNINTVSAQQLQAKPVGIEAKTQAGEGSLFTTLRITNPNQIIYPGAYYVVKLQGEDVQKLSDYKGQKVTEITQGQLITYVNSAKFTLGAGSSSEFSFNLKFSPAIPPGNYKLQAALFGGDDQLLGSVVNEVSLSGTGGFLDIKNCVIVADKVEYDPISGPNVAPKAEVYAKCSVTNPNSSVISAFPQAEYAVDSVVGTQASEIQMFTSSKVLTFPARGTTNIILPLPVLGEPQVYEALVSLKNNQGNIVSSKKAFRWVIAGESSSIRSIALDKNDYKKGEIAKVTIGADPSMDLFWRGGGPAKDFTGISASSAPFVSPKFQGTPLTNALISVSIKDGLGQVCGSGEKKVDINPNQNIWPDQTLDVPLDKNCNNLKVVAKVVNNGKELASKEVSMPVIVAGDKITNSNMNYWIGGIILAVILAVGGIGFYLWKKKKFPPVKPNIPATLVVFLALGLFHTGFGITGLQTFSPIKTACAQSATPSASIIASPTASASASVAPSQSPSASVQPSASASASVSPPNGTEIGPGSPVSVHYEGIKAYRPNQACPGPAWQGQPQFSDGAGGCVLDIVSGFDETNFTYLNTEDQITYLNGQFSVPIKGQFKGFGCGNTRIGLIVRAYVNGTNQGVKINGGSWRAVFPNLAENGGGSGTDVNLNLTITPGGADICAPQDLKLELIPRIEHMNIVASDLTEDDLLTSADVPGWQNVTYTNRKNCGTSGSCWGVLRKSFSASELGICGPSPSPSPTPTPTPPPACGISCERDGQCVGAKDNCTACIGGVCKPPPACGTSCTTRADCTGATKDGCVECLEGSCTNFSDNMCKCDGITADIIYPSDSFKFEAFGKIDGANAKKAEIADITFRLTKDNQVVAKSNPITPTVVENSANKVRFKASWNTPPPAISRGSTYRVFADVRCKPKKIIASSEENFTPNMQLNAENSPKPPVGLKWALEIADKLFNSKQWLGRAVVGEVMAQLGSPTPSPSGAQSNLQLQTLNFVKLMDTDNCRFVMFKFDETLF